MLEVKYVITTGVILAWASSPKHTGGHYEPEDGEAVAVLDIPNPEQSSSAYLYDEATQTLIDNPDYVKPKPFNTKTEIKDLKARVTELEK